METEQKPPSTLWLNTLIFSFIVLVTFSFYLFIRRGGFEIFSLNQAFAATGMILIGLSFALSALCHFWDIFDSKIIYRKHLGLLGFAFVLAHIFIILFPLSTNFPFPSYFLTSDQITPFISAVLALLIFMMMAAISNRFAIDELGGAHWRMLLRTGYIAYFLALVHIGFSTYNFWLRWFSTFTPYLPPLSLLVFVFGVLVLILRIALWFSTRTKAPPVAT